MINNNEEQALCKDCGLCCDGTLFARATIKNSDDLIVAKKYKLECFQNEKGLFFKQPCCWFENKCLLYNQKRPYICGAFHCKLLLDFRNKRIDFDSALKHIKSVKRQCELLRRDMNAFAEFDDVPIGKLGIILNNFQLEASDKVLFRKKYGKIIIQVYALNEIKKKYFYKKKE